MTKSVDTISTNHRLSGTRSRPGCLRFRSSCDHDRRRRDLNAPELQSQFNQLVATGKAQIALAQQLINANDVNQANAIVAKGKTLGDRFDSTAQSMGLTECAKDVQPQG